MRNQPLDHARMSRPLFWAAFVVVHVVVSWLVLVAPHTPLNDVTGVYFGWMQQALSGGPLVGIDQAWVYPIAALVPMWIPLLGAAGGAAGYGYAWLVLVAVLDAAGLAVLVGRGRSRPRMNAAWWFLAFLLLLGGIGVGRLDALTAPIVLVGMLLALSRPAVASVILSVATWIKVWPAAVLAAGFIALRSRWSMAVAAIATSVVLVGIALAFGSGSNVFTFITEQTGRGIQVEAPVALPYLWAASAHLPGFGTYFDRTILTFQVLGFGQRTVASLMTPILVAGLIIVIWFGWRAVRAGASTIRLFPQLALALVLVFIVLNKVGSPQYLSWLIAPVAVLIVVGGRRVPLLAGLALVLAALTQLIYPFFYDSLLRAETWMVALITVRNLGFVVMLVIVAGEIWASGSRARARSNRTRGDYARAANRAQTRAHESSETKE